MRALLFAALLLLAGCAEESPGTTPTTGMDVPEADAITPGKWHVNGDTDHMLFWAHNDGSSVLSGTWNLTLRDEQPLPEGWNLTFSSAKVTLQAKGTKQGRSYPDWGWTLATLKLPPNATGGSFEAEIHAGTLKGELEITVETSRVTVSKPGSNVHVEYAGSFQDNQEEFDAGDFSTKLGSGQTVPGFDYGLMGLAKEEQVSLHVPPAMAYGYDNPAGSGYEQFNGRWLVFDVELASIA